MKLRRFITTAAVTSLAATTLVACGDESEDTSNGAEGGSETITIGTTDASKEAWSALEEAADAEGIDLEIENFADYSTPNQALSQGQLDVNSFQHLMFLAEYNEGNNEDLVPIASTEVVPLALFWEGHDSLDGIEGEDIAIPNDATNQARAIIVLTQAGLLTLNDEDLISPTPADIDTEASSVSVTPVDAAQTPAAYGEGRPAVINNSFLDRAGIDPNLAVYEDDPASEDAEPYINVMVVRAEDADNEQILELAQLWHTDEVLDAVDRDSRGTSVPVDRSTEELQEILERLEEDVRENG